MSEECVAMATESSTAVKERLARIADNLEARFPEFESNARAMDEHRLTTWEIFWRDLYYWLEEKGYRLRPRYHPNWVASWKDSDTPYELCEDGQEPLDIANILDATRISDGKQVVLKRVDTNEHPREASFGRLFSSEPNSSDASNYCIPVYDVLDIPDEQDIIFIVMPFLGPWIGPPFETVGEAVEFFRQIFEGVQFMHRQQTAHNDIKGDNIMMEYTHLYDEAIHPVDRDMKFDWSGKATKPHSRTLRPVTYQLIDFGHTQSYQDSDDNPPSEPVGYGGDHSVPEFLTQDNCDPFAVDVYRIGNVIREQFTNGNRCHRKKRSLEFMEPLLHDMCQDDPTKRPTIDEVVSRFAKILKGLSCYKLRSRLVDHNETRSDALRRFPAHWARQLTRIVRRIPAIPRP